MNGRVCVICGQPLPANADRRRRAYSAACSRTLGKKLTREWRQARRGSPCTEPRLCVECGTEFTRGDRRTAITCGVSCSAKRHERQQRESDLARRETRCSRQRCDRAATKGAPICGVHLPRFDHEPKPRPRRASLEELEHYTYGGTSISAQLAESRREAWVKRERQRSGLRRLAIGGRSIE